MMKFNKSQNKKDPERIKSNYRSYFEFGYFSLIFSLSHQCKPAQMKFRILAGLLYLKRRAVVFCKLLKSDFKIFLFIQE